MNKSILMGRLTKAPELKYTPSSVAVCTFTLAVDRRYKKEGEERQADFINIVTWQKLAEFVSKHFGKGDKILIVGHIQTSSYDVDGEKKYKTEVIADEAYFCESKKNGSTPVGNTNENTGGFYPVDDDDELPF